MIIVSKKGTGNYTSIQEAVQSIDDRHEEIVTLFIEPGIYEEKIFIRKNNIQIIGQDRNTTIIRYGDGAKKKWENGTDYGTFNTATVLFSGSHITVRNITFENNAGPGKIAGQAIAAYIASDTTAFYHCAFLGHQDTIFTGDLKEESFKHLVFPDFFNKSIVPIDFPVIRNYFENCYIVGDVDYIFGPNIAYFYKCTLFTRLLSSESTSYITAASTPQGQEYGYVFMNCTVEGEGEVGSIYLGRPWRDYAKTAFLECCLDGHIHPSGWHNWGRSKAEVTTTYLEYGNTGEGAPTNMRIAFSKQLTNPDIIEYFSVLNVLGGHDQWAPKENK